MEDMEVNLSFWHGRRVFVTGHTGFKGSWLCLWLQSLGAKVYGYALPPPTSPSLFDIARVAAGMESVIADVRDLPQLVDSIRSAAPEIVFHMAAQPLVRASYQDAVGTFATNVMGTVNLLEAVRRADTVRALVSVTTDKCYENREWHWGYRESDRLGGYDPYSSSKACAELATAAFRSSFFAPAQHSVGVATARAGNVIGGGDWARDRLIPDIVAAFEADRPVSIRNPHAIRPWQHVLEPLHGYLILAQSLVERGAQFAEAWNFGPPDDDARPVGWLVERMAQIWGTHLSWIAEPGVHPHEASYLKLDTSKAHALLGWRPVLRLEDALQWVVQWHHARIHRADLREQTLAQIASYESLLLNHDY